MKTKKLESAYLENDFAKTATIKTLGHYDNNLLGAGAGT